MTGSCACGAVTVTVPTSPEFANECNCTLCTKLGAIWSYHAMADVRITGDTHGFARADVETPTARMNFCPSCGTTTHFAAVDPAAGFCGVNVRLFDMGDLSGVEHRFPDGRNWDRKSAFGYVRPHAVFA